MISTLTVISHIQDGVTLNRQVKFSNAFFGGDNFDSVESLIIVKIVDKKQEYSHFSLLQETILQYPVYNEIDIKRRS